MKTLCIFLASLLASIAIAEETFTVEFVIGKNGMLIGETTQEVVSGGNTTEVRISPNAGYETYRWSDNNRDNPRVIENVTSDMRLIAFLQQVRYRVQYIAGPNGSITGPDNQFVNLGQDTLLVTAIPDENFVFFKWDDDKTNNPRMDIGVTFPMFPVAEFRERHEYTYNLVEGWNFVSIPFVPLSTRVSDVFPLVQSVLWWDSVEQSYAQGKEIMPGTGYWVFTPRAHTVTVFGTKARSDSFPSELLSKPNGALYKELSQGWNLVSVLSPTAAPLDLGIVWEHSPDGFRSTQILLPVKAYWMYVDGDVYSLNLE
jgi:hypothetical protein